MSGRGRLAVASLATALVSGPCHGADRLVVVHDAGGTVDAAPYVERPVISEDRIGEALARAGQALLALEPGHLDVFPVEPDPLQPAWPVRIRVPGLTTPVYAIGPDRASLAWLAANAEELRERGAEGFVVSCATADGLDRIRAYAARLGLSVEAMPGFAFAEAFGAVSYPFVAEPPP